MENKTTHPPRVAVIGSGISGIAAAVVLQKNGFQVEIFEKSGSIGGVWALAYPNVRLQNIAEQYHISDFPWPFKPDLHPTGAQILQYLNQAVDHFQLTVRLEHEIIALEETPNGWSASIQTREGLSKSHFDFVMVSNGHYSDGKNNFGLPNQGSFQGQVVTERDIKSLAAFRDKRVAVVGFGKSAVDMADFAVQQGAAQVFHVFRTPRWMFPRQLFGVHFTHYFFNRFGSVMMPSWSHPSAVERLIHSRSKGVVEGFWKMVQRLLVGKILKRGAKLGAEAQGRLRSVIPDHPLVADLRSASCLEPENYYSLVAEGRIQPYHSEVKSFNVNGLQLKTGVAIACDMVVLSLGSLTPSFPFLPTHYRNMLESEPDGAQLYRHLIHPRIPRLGFAGFNHGFMHVSSVEVGTLWLSALWKGELELPPIAKMEESIAYLQTWKRTHIHFEPSRSCGVNTRFQQYLDILLLDLGLSPYRKWPNVVAEVFARYRAADYAKVQQDYQRRSAQKRPLKPSGMMH